MKYFEQKLSFLDDTDSPFHQDFNKTWQGPIETDVQHFDFLR